MSLSQASSPEETKRDIKLQVFLAMNNKYSSGQTDRLIEDMGKVTDDIMGKSSSTVDMSLPQEFVESVRNKPMAGRCAGVDKDHQNTKRHLFIGGRHDGDIRLLTVNSNFAPHKESIGLPIGGGNARKESATTVYYRHFLTVVAGDWVVTRWFYCDEKDISNWTERKMLSTLDRINKFFVNNMEDPMNNI